MPKSSVGRATVEVNGVDCTSAFDQLELEQRELTKAQELASYLLKQHLAEAGKTSIAGRFSTSLSLTFDRLAGRTSIKAKVAYSRKYTDELVEFAQHGQGGLFESISGDV
jgi:hypothetical protein